MLKFEDEELRWQQVMSRISFYKHEVEKAITHGYHDESMASYDGGVHHQKFCKDKKELEKAVDEYLNIMSEL